MRIAMIAGITGIRAALIDADVIMLLGGLRGGYGQCGG